MAESGIRGAADQLGGSYQDGGWWRSPALMGEWNGAEYKVQHGGGQGRSPTHCKVQVVLAWHPRRVRLRLIGGGFGRQELPLGASRRLRDVSLEQRQVIEEACSNLSDDVTITEDKILSKLRITASASEIAERVKASTVFLHRLQSHTP